MDNFYYDSLDCLNQNSNQLNRPFSFKILQLNIRGMNSLEKFDAVKEFLALYSGQIDMVVIGETWVKAERKSLFGIEGYRSIFSCREDTLGGGLAVFVKSKFEFEEVACLHDEGMHHIHLRMKLDESDFDVHAIYRPPSFDLAQYFRKIDSICSTHRKSASCVIVGDMNIPVNLVNRGVVSEYLDLLRCYNFLVTNSYSTRPASNNILDHVVCSENVQGNVTNETIFTDISDHCFVLSSFQFKRSVKMMTLEKNIVNHTKLNDAFHAAMQNMPQGNANDKLLYVLNTYQSLKEKFSSTVTVQAKIKGCCPWMTFELWKLISMKDKILKNSKRRPGDIGLQESLAHISRKVQHAKMWAKKNYYNTLFQESSPKKVWDNINEVIGRRKEGDIAVNLMVDGQITGCGVTVADSFNQFFSTVGPQLASTMNSSKEVNKFNTLRFNNNSIFLSPTTEHEVLLKINALDSKKSCGSDGITATFLKVHHGFFASLLTDVFNECISSGTFPDSLKIARVIPIHKSGCKTDVNNYRPISVLSTFSKLLEQLYASRLLAFLEEHRILYERQFGFRTGSSTWTATCELVDSIYSAVDNRKISGVLFLDLKKAFDTIDHEILLRKLEFYGVRGTANDFIRSYLTNRTQYVKVNKSVSSLCPLTVGVPQGSNLGPILFLLYINDLPKLKLNGKPRMFADDTSLSYEADDPDQLIRQMSEDMTNLQDYFTENLLSLNLTKSKYMIFHSSRRRIPDHCELSINSQVIEKVEEMKYLGLTFDPNLTWRIHIERLRREISSFCGVLWKISKFVPHKQLSTIYHAFIQSKLCYLVSIWGTAPKTILKPLQVTQNRCLRIVYNKPRMFSTETLYRQAAQSTLPILALREMQTLVSMQNLIRNPSTHHNFMLQQPDHLHNTRNQANLFITRRNTENGKKAFDYRGKISYNCLPASIKAEHNLYKFKVLVRSHIRNRLEQFII